MRRALPLLLTLLGGCSPSLDADRDGTRAEIVALQKSIPPESPLWIFDGPDRFDSALTDGEPGIPDFLYHHLLRKLDALSDEEIDAQSKGDFDFEECAKDPGLFRGKFWRVHGVIGEIHGEPVSDPKGPVPVAHAGVFFTRALQPVLFHVTRKPEVLTLREDAVEIRALFVKWIDYRSKSGRTVTAPFFVGRTLRHYL
ncbi:MAG TPA: hypothetical protein VKW04_04315 [Planctomycetota bacterium]|nr:hypothetical protein [Planctomycetota bacterium]